MEEIRFIRGPIQLDLWLQEAIRERYLEESSVILSGFPALTQVFRDQTVPANYYEATFGPVSISYSLTSKRGGVTAMKCTGGAIVVQGGTMIGVASDLGAEECPASFTCSQDSGAITYTPHT